MELKTLLVQKITNRFDGMMAGLQENFQVSIEVTKSGVDGGGGLFVVTPPGLFNFMVNREADSKICQNCSAGALVLDLE